MNNMSLRFKAIPVNEAFARGVVAAFCVPLNPTVEVINDIKTAVSEAVTNCIVHAYRDKEGYITVEAEIAENVLTVKISDDGVGIADVDAALNDFYTTSENEERSGLGFTIMKSFMDSLEVTSKNSAGTAVIMTKRL